MRYLIGPFIAGSANLIQNDFVAGLPSPLAALGFAGALVRKLNTAMVLSIHPWSPRVLPVLHRVSVSSGRLRPAPSAEFNKAIGRYELKGGELAETMTGEAILSIVIEIDAILDAADIEPIVRDMRFAGSAIFAPGFHAGEIQVRRLEGATLKQATPIDRGFALLPSQREGTQFVSFGDLAGLEHVAHRLSAPRQPGAGYIVPVAAGLRLLEDPHGAPIRKGGRNDGTAHVFSEPAVGFAELVSIRNPDIADLPEDDLSHRMWRWAPDEAHRHVMYSPTHLAALAAPAC